MRARRPERSVIMSRGFPVREIVFSQLYDDTGPSEWEAMCQTLLRRGDLVVVLARHGCHLPNEWCASNPERFTIAHELRQLLVP
jgi:hypothetical protein